MIEAAIDNDVLIKGAVFELLEPIAAGVAKSAVAVGVLHASRFVCRDALRKKTITGDRAAKSNRLEAFLSKTTSIEPTGAEVALAAELEETALKASLTLDAGESLLAAVTISRRIPVFVTGDKRAIVSLAKVLEGSPHLDWMAGKVLCFEQAVLQVVLKMGCDPVRPLVCAEPAIDKVMAICFACASTSAESVDCQPCLKSYIAHARAGGGRLLAPIGT